MENYFTRILKYAPTEKRTPKENMVTETMNYILESDSKLKKNFLKKLLEKASIKSDGKGLEKAIIKTQVQLENMHGKKKSIPDMEIELEGKSYILIEYKIDSEPDIEQITEYLGFLKNKREECNGNVALILIARDENFGKIEKEFNKLEHRYFISWDEISDTLHDYKNKKRVGEILEQFVEYLKWEEIMGAFDGIRFSEKFPYSYEKSWEYIKKLTGKLDLSDVDGFENFKWKERKPRTEKESAWTSYYPKDKGYSKVPHFTLSLTYDALQVSVTMPVYCGRRSRFNKFVEDKEAFLSTLVKVREKLPNLWLYLSQHHSVARISDAYASFRIDAVVEDKDLKGKRINKINRDKGMHSSPWWYDFLSEIVKKQEKIEYQFTVWYYLSKKHSNRKCDNEKNEKRYKNIETKECVKEVKEALKYLKKIYDEIS
jgi:hypothetical protein